MDENRSNSKVLGLKSSDYVKISYMLVLAAAGLGLVLNLFSSVGLAAFTGSTLVSLLGLIGWVMALVGWLGFQKEFSLIEQSHLRFITVLFVACFVIGLVLAVIFGGAGVLWLVVAALFGAAQIGLLYLAFRLWQKGQEASQDTLKAEFEVLRGQLQNRKKM